MVNRQVGKRVGGALYLHRTALREASDDIQRLVIEAEFISPTDWNVAKIRGRVISLLEYENFDEAAFPALLTSTRIDLTTQRVVSTDYRSRNNPPILHRKETLLPLFDPRRPTFTAITKVAEEAGLFVESNKIGTLNAWKALLEKAGFEVRGPELLRRGTASASVARHKTAIIRCRFPLIRRLELQLEDCFIEHFENKDGSGKKLV